TLPAGRIFAQIRVKVKEEGENMPLHLSEDLREKGWGVHVSGKLHRQEYEKFVPDKERLIKQYGKIRVLMVMRDFHGWDTGALWEDIKWDAKHFNDVERVAIVGEK